MAYYFLHKQDLLDILNETDRIDNCGKLKQKLIHLNKQKSSPRFQNLGLWKNCHL